MTLFKVKIPRYRVFESKTLSMSVFSANWQFLAEAYVKIEDYYPSGKRFLFRLEEKRGKEKELTIHHKLEELLNKYLKNNRPGEKPDSPLFQAAIGKTGKLSRRPLVRTRCPDMLKRRLKQAGLPGALIPGDRNHECS